MSVYEVTMNMTTIDSAKLKRGVENMSLISESRNPFHEGIDPNEDYDLVQLLGEGSYGSVYKGGSRILL
jgi:hypothetical protein